MYGLVRKRRDLAYSGEVKNVCEPFEGKRVTVMGLGLLGRGVGDVEFLAKCGAEVLVTDKKTDVELAESVEKLKAYPNVTLHLGGSSSTTALGFSKTEYRQENLGGHDEKDFTDCDMVFKAAGVPMDSPYIAAARRAGVAVYMSTALFAKYAMEEGATIVGVTGTRGKSTVTQMIYHTLMREKLFLPLPQTGETVSPQRPVLLGGNIRGISTLALLPEVTKDSIVVLELDSWQLQGFGDLKISPQVAVFTNLMADHQNYYKDEAQYFADKVNIFRHQRQGDTLVIGKSLEERFREVKPPVEARMSQSIPEDWQLKIPGEHNRENASLAAEALRALGLSEDAIRAGLESFGGVEGRLQLVREINGVKIYNDNNATTPDATIAALNALDPAGKQNVVLIIGGADKGLDVSGMQPAVHAHCKKAFFLAGTGTERIRTDSPDTPVFSSLKEAIEAAMAAAVPDDIILFSPAFASFGMFKNEYDRNDQFVAAVKAL